MLSTKSKTVLIVFLISTGAFTLFLAVGLLFVRLRKKELHLDALVEKRKGELRETRAKEMTARLSPTTQGSTSVKQALEPDLEMQPISKQDGKGKAPNPKIVVTAPSSSSLELPN
ncbi:hypothetical protein AC578_7838 [Pseudocercospora eumusae]|uniref:Uncharacterized protein n=1 Tax=Pseudocercospora eumusae TaxID=321146 RepID=A0A139HIW9_9PEZI|nr:hypothetical protein AC578_7838 [Pseudocercospora eumusae]